MKTAFITGITGQDGAYLTQLLLSKGYHVHGLVRWTSNRNNTKRIEQYLDHPNVTLHMGYVSDAARIIDLVKQIQPTEIYNLAAMSHVAHSFDTPREALDVNGGGTLNLLEAIRINQRTDRTRFFQASTSELFGNAEQSPQNEGTPLIPRSPYGAAKLYAYSITTNYREAYGLHASNGICFNHESPLRSAEFVTRKITLAAAMIAHGKQDCLYLGNLDATRDWGHARDYVRAMWSMLQQPKADNYVIATGETTTIRDFAIRAFKAASIDITWNGTGDNEIGVNSATGKTLIRIDPAFKRPSELHSLLGDPSKAVRELDFNPRATSLDELIHEMIESDMYLVKTGEGNTKQRAQEFAKTRTA